MKKILVTGASGFIGAALVQRLLADGRASVRGMVRTQSAQLPEGVEQVIAQDLAGADFTAAVAAVDVVVHAAARVHVVQDSAADPLAEFRRVNVAGTLRLARQAVHSGVRRFVFVSSIKVNGERTAPSRPFTPDDRPAPVDAYGVSKQEAEQGLREIARETGLEVVIVRPVLVYGPGVKANFLSMMRWLRRGIPLPLGAIDNRRSLVALDNLVDLIATCVDHPAAANQTFLVSDGEDVSTSDLLRRLGRAVGKPARLLPVPGSVLAAGGMLCGRRDVVQRLCGSLQVDIAKARDLLGWSPPIGVDEGLRRAARDIA